jgi:GT2 family glycosyltransferase
MVRPAVFWQVGGNDERLRVAYNDVDLGLRIRQAGDENVYTPYARLTHNEGATRKGAEPAEDEIIFAQRWRPYEYVDQYYNPHLDPYRPFHIRLEADAVRP